ncbi:MAG: nucleoside-diphosphate sugar epimerase/dehydratase [Terracidiphilus sp.]
MFPKSLLSKSYSAKLIRHRIVKYLLDWIAFALAGLFAFEIRFDATIPANYLHAMAPALCAWIVVKSIAFIASKLDRGDWQYTSIHDVARIVIVNTAGSFFGGIVICILLGLWGIPRSVYILDWLFSCLFTTGSREAARMILASYRSKLIKGTRTRTIIYGAGAAGLALLWELRQNDSLMCEVVGIIDDDPSKAHLILQGKRVFGAGNVLDKVVKKYNVQRVLIAIPSATGSQMARILRCALDAGVEYKMVPSLGDLIQGAELGKQLRNVSVEDLLGRKPVQLDLDGIRERIQGQVVMVTGAGGSIGSEICRQIARFNPGALIGFDEAETPLFQIEEELKHSFPDLVFHAEIGSITRPDTLRHVMSNHHPRILYHAAAYKHVPMMEKHIFAAVETNILGTWQVAQAAIHHGVEVFVMISTDKAVRPTSMMGATKRVAEMMIRTLQQSNMTNFVAVRFGNVLGSNGSVVPIFKAQIAAGGPVTVTHPDMSRYFMTIPEASQLVLQAFSIGKGGELFVLDMGKPVKIVDLAKDLILLSGLQPDRDIKIEFSGLRPGEKLFEELNLQDERLQPTSHNKIRQYICPMKLSSIELKVYLKQFQNIIDCRDVTRLVFLLKELIPEYNPGTQLLKAALTSGPCHFGSVEVGSPDESTEYYVSGKLALAAQTNRHFTVAAF